jgi:hypothetical protein
VFPLQPRGKTPIEKGGFKTASWDAEQILAHWTRWPLANIGIPTGAVSGIDVLDIDPGGEDSLSALIAQHGSLPDTREVKTGRGRQSWFKHPAVSIRCNAGVLGRGLDVRADGGYIVAPPSIHPNGTVYTFLNDLPFADMPPWLVCLLTKHKPPAMVSREDGAKIPQGRRNTHLASMAGKLRRVGLCEETIFAALLSENARKCTPPLEELEVRRIAESVARYSPGAVPGILASEVTPKKVDWLWPRRLPLGKVIVFEGDPDEGKSTTAIELAARVTIGADMPDGSPGIPASGAVIVSLEDGIDDTIVPRLMAAKADLSKVRIIKTIRGQDGIDRTPTLPVDLPEIEAAIKDVGARILVIDPLVATLASDTNSFRDQDIRRVLAPVEGFAEANCVAAIVIRHLNKGNNPNPKYRGGGSIGILGASRAGFLFGDSPDNDGSKIMAAVKTNLCAKPPAMRYRLRQCQVTFEGQIETVALEWQGESSHTAKALLAEAESEEDSNTLAEAKAFLLEALKDGPQDSKALLREAREAGIASEKSHRTLDRAKAILGVKSRKVGMGSGQHWEWELPKDAKPPLLAFLNSSGEDPALSDPESSIPPKDATKDAKGSELASFGDVIDNKIDRTCISSKDVKDAKDNELASFGRNLHVCCKQVADGGQFSSPQAVDSKEQGQNVASDNSDYVNL